MGEPDRAPYEEVITQRIDGKMVIQALRIRKEIRG